ncbi:MAG: DUF6689 family protein [Acidobacteriota bacterium]
MSSFALSPLFLTAWLLASTAPGPAPSSDLSPAAPALASAHASGAIAGAAATSVAGSLVLATGVVEAELLGDHAIVGYFEVGTGCPTVERAPRETQARPRSGRVRGISDDCFDGEFFLRFDDPDDLQVEDLDFTIEQLDPDHPDLTSRLPTGPVFLPDEFPVRLTITPDTGGDLPFEDGYELEIETRSIDFLTETPLRLFKAEDGCSAPGCEFRGITFASGFGSFRIRGASGGFSEFIVAADLRRPSVVTDARFANFDADLQFFIQDGAFLDTQFQADVENTFADARIKYNANDVEGTFIKLFDLIELLEDGADMDKIDTTANPNTGDISAAGTLIGLAEGIVYALEEEDRVPAISTGGVSTTLTTQSGHEVDLLLNFDNRNNVQRDALTIAAVDVDPFDANLLARLPTGVSIPADFPVKVNISVNTPRRPVIEGDWAIALRTEELVFRADRPLRLFNAVAGNIFRDITTKVSQGSLQIEGEEDRFNASEYLIVIDSRPNDTTTLTKFTDLRTQILDFDLSPNVEGELLAELDSAKDLFDMQSDPAGATSKMNDFLSVVRNRAGSGLFPVWRASGALTNEVGRLSSGGQSIKFSLSVERSIVPDSADVNGDGSVDALDVFLVIDRAFCPGGVCTDLPDLPVIAPPSPIDPSASRDAPTASGATAPLQP